MTSAGIAVIYTWFYNNTESVLLAILFHMTTNVVMAYLQTSPALTFITGIMPWVIAIFLLKRYGAETLTGIGTGGESPEIKPIPEDS